MKRLILCFTASIFTFLAGVTSVSLWSSSSNSSSKEFDKALSFFTGLRCHTAIEEQATEEALTSTPLDKLGTFQFEKTEGGHTAKIIFQTKEFDPSKHRVEYGNFHNRVDGRIAYGAESVPTVEISSIRFLFDGKEIEVPQILYRDCYNPNFESPYVKVRFSQNYDGVIVSMSGADGAGGYEVIWRLNKNGKHSWSAADADDV